MNLFTISDNTKYCAQCLDDVLLGKTIIESAQMLSTAIHMNENIFVKPDGIYKKYNANEEHNKWVRESKSNYKWTFFYLCDCLNEYKYRFGKEHDTRNIVPILCIYENFFPMVEMTPFTRKFSKDLENYNELMEIKDTCWAYKQYLISKWKEKTLKGKEPKWTNRNKPDFYKEEQ